MNAMHSSGYSGNGWCDFGLFFPGPFGMIFSLLLWTVIILALVKLVQLLLKNKSQQINSNKPVNSLELLKERYARGDIDEETYQKIKQELLSRS